MIDCIVCDMMKSNTSLCMWMCMFNIIFEYYYTMSSHYELCVHLGFELVLIGVWYNSGMNYFEIFYWCASVKPDQMLIWYITVPYVFACDILVLDDNLNCCTTVYIVYCVMCLGCFIVCCSAFTDTCPVDCGISYLLYGAAFVLVLCGSPLTVTWG